MKTIFTFILIAAIGVTPKVFVPAARCKERIGCYTLPRLRSVGNTVRQRVAAHLRLRVELS